MCLNIEKASVQEHCAVRIGFTQILFVLFHLDFYLAIWCPYLLGINHFTSHAKRFITRQHWEKWMFVCQKSRDFVLLKHWIQLCFQISARKNVLVFFNLHTSVQPASHFVFFFPHKQLNPRDVKFKHLKTLLRKGGEAKTIKCSQSTYKKVRGQRKAGDATNQFLLRLFLSSKYLSCSWITTKQSTRRKIKEFDIYKYHI